MAEAEPDEATKIALSYLASCVSSLYAEKKQLQRQVDELQTANTRLLEERRAVDIHYNVEQLKRGLEHPMRETPGVPSDERVRFCLRLIAEEFKELLASCLALDTDPDEFVVSNRFFSSWPSVEAAIDKLRIAVDLPEFADACTDIDYVVEGARLEFGIDGRPILTAVHNANMKKIGGPKRADSKGLKPEGWQPPDVAGELRKQGWRP